jgi:hypothetical protein
MNIIKRGFDVISKSWFPNVETVPRTKRAKILIFLVSIFVFELKFNKKILKLNQSLLVLPFLFPSINP